MHLAELLSLRALPAAGLTMGLTRRCPMKCEHCSTSSTMTSEHHPGGMFARFVDTFRPDCRPEVLALSGGEALLRPDLVRDLAVRAREAGARSTLVSGMFFATLGRIPPAIRAAIAAVDHLAVSVDIYHEHHVPRADVFRAIDTLLGDGKDISVHVVGRDALDPYIEDIVADVRRVFAGRVPMLVNAVAALGRARTWLRRGPPPVDADPPAPAAWPAVAFDGTIVACGTDEALVRAPAQLRLGHVDADDWATVRMRLLEASAARPGDVETVASRRVATPSARRPSAAPPRPPLAADAATQRRRDGALAFARRHGLPRYAELALLGDPA